MAYFEGIHKNKSYNKRALMPDNKPTLRSAQWFGTADKNGFMYRSWMKNQGIADHQFNGKPIIGICNTWSELTPCNAHFRTIAEHVKRGVIEAGGFPVEFPVFSNGESNLRPTAMLTRNLASMDVEEAIRGNPIDGVVLLTGCDKTTPALLMGAASCDVPAIVVTGGPMLNGKHKGKDIGAGTIVWQMHESYKAGRVRPVPATPWALPRPWPAWLKRWALRCRTTPPFLRWIRVATC
jgi:L-arabonate dehydrase